MAIYSVTNMSNITTVGDFLKNANSVASNWLFVGLDMMIFFIVFLSMINFGFEVSLLTASFLVMLIALFMAYMGLVAWWFVGLWIGFILVTIIYIIWNSRYD